MGFVSAYFKLGCTSKATSTKEFVVVFNKHRLLQMVRYQLV